MAVIPKIQPNVQLRALPTNTTQGVQGKGLGQMAGALRQAADTVQDIAAKAQAEREKLEMAEVLQAENDFNRQRASLEIKFRELQGRNAFGKTGDYRALLDNTRQATAARLKDERLRTLFMQRTEAGRNSTATSYEQHVSGEGKRMEAEAHRTYEETARGEAARLWSNDQAFQEMTANAATAFLAREKAAGSDEATAYKRFNESMRELYHSRMEAAIKSGDPTAARMVFEQIKDPLGGYREEAEAAVRRLEAPAQAEAFAVAATQIPKMEDGTPKSEWFSAGAARASVDAILDSDPTKQHKRELVEQRIRAQDDAQRRLWDERLSNLSTLRWQGKSLYSAEIQTIMHAAMDPNDSYSTEARAWWDNEMAKAKMSQAERDAKQPEYDQIALNAYHAIADLNNRVKPRGGADATPEERIYRDAYGKASLKMKLRITALQHADEKVLQDPVSWERARRTVAERIKSTNILQTNPNFWSEFDEWFTGIKQKGQDPTAEQLSTFIGEKTILSYGKKVIGADVPVYGDTSGKPTGAGVFTPSRYETAPKDKQNTDAQKVIDARAAESAAAAAPKVDPRWRTLSRDTGARSEDVLALLDRGMTYEQARVALTAAPKPAAAAAAPPPQPQAAPADPTAMFSMDDAKGLMAEFKDTKVSSGELMVMRNKRWTLAQVRGELERRRAAKQQSRM